MFFIGLGVIVFLLNCWHIGFKCKHSDSVFIYISQIIMINLITIFHHTELLYFYYLAMPAWGILEVFWSGSNPCLPLEAQSLNYWTMREVPQYHWLYSPPYPRPADSTNRRSTRFGPWMQNPWMWRADSTTPFYVRGVEHHGFWSWRDPITNSTATKDDCILCAKMLQLCDLFTL